MKTNIKLCIFDLDFTLHNEIVFLKKAFIDNKPILGICSGFQILCVIFGERIVDSKEIGMTNVITTQNNPLISGEFQAYNMHNFSAKIPITFNILAKTEETIQLVSHKELNIFGVLFHPEVRNEQIVTNFLLI